MTRFVEQTPDGQGWRIGGYRFTVGDDGTLYRQYPGGALVSVVSVGEALSNGDIINGVAHFVTDTKPTQRIPTIDNPTPPLVTGDRWYKSDDGTDWFWNGTYWLSQIATMTNRIQAFSSSTTVLFTGESGMPATIFIHKVGLTTNIGGTVSDYFVVTPCLTAIGGNLYSLPVSFNTSTYPGNYYEEKTVNVYRNQDPSWGAHYGGVITVLTGTRTSNLMFTYFYSLVAP